MGRSSTFTAEIAQRVCDELAGGKSLRAVCSPDDMPAPSTVLGWVEAFPEFGEQYARARLMGWELRADEIIDISDDSRGDTYIDEEGVERTDNERVARARLRVDSRKWMLSKMLPKVYGDRLTTELTGADGKDLIPQADPQDVARRVAFLLAKGTQ